MDGQKTQCRYCWTKTNTWLHTYWNIQTSVVVPIMLTARTNNHKAIAVDLLPSSNWELVSSSPEPELFISLESVRLLSSFLPEAKDVHVMLNWQLQLVFRL